MYLNELKRKYNLLEDTFVVFDVETTGLSPRNDKLIEIGAVKIKKGQIIDQFSELINPEIIIPPEITNITKITNKMVEKSKSADEVVKKFLDWAGDCTFVAHNAKFDVSFIKVACYRYRLGPFLNEVIDTMWMARTLYPDWHDHKLESLTNNLKVTWDEEQHHRALYDAIGTSKAFYKMCQEIDSLLVG